MDIVIPLALLVVGLIIGFFVARFMYTKDQSVNASIQAEKNIKEMMSQQAQHHLSETRQVIDGIYQQCNQLKQQLNDYEQLLHEAGDESSPRVPFYGEQATSYLRNNLSNKKNRTSQPASTQPKDFSNSPSGLFVGRSEQSVADKE